MVRPGVFFVNPETAFDNAFQNPARNADLTRLATAEFDLAVETLKGAGIDVEILNAPPSAAAPDAVFPNNWFSTHRDGTLVLYPMKANNRRLERRADLIETLSERMRIDRTLDLSAYENDQQYLEGTGALVLDRDAKIAYVSESERANAELVEVWCEAMGYQSVVFRTSVKGKPVYHTNVMMTVGEDFALVCFEAVVAEDRSRLRNTLMVHGKEVIELSCDQLSHFCGNTLELHSDDRSHLVLSQSAFDGLSKRQRERLSERTTLLPIHIPTIELAGGSARCMLAKLALPKLSKPNFSVAPDTFSFGFGNEDQEPIFELTRKH